MEYQKTAEATDDLISNNIADKITKILRYSLNNNTEIITNKHDKETPKEQYISSEERQKIIDKLIIIYNILMEYQKMINLLDNTPNQTTKFRLKIRLKQMMMHVKHIAL